MSQDQLWELFKMVQSERVSLDDIKADTSATLQQNTALEDRVGQLEGGVSISKNANVLLKKEVCRLERKILADNQYGRLENIEISGIQTSILPLRADRYRHFCLPPSRRRKTERWRHRAICQLEGRRRHVRKHQEVEGYGPFISSGAEPSTRICKCQREP